jgi:hypothetical protein
MVVAPSAPETSPTQGAHMMCNNLFGQRSTIMFLSRKAARLSAFALVVSLGACQVEPPPVARFAVKSAPPLLTPTETTITIPQDAQTINPAPNCSVNGFDLRKCLVGLIASKTDDDNLLTIVISSAPGQGAAWPISGASGGLIIFQKKYITITGLPPASDGSLPTKIAFSNVTNGPNQLLRFFAEVIDSSNITISNLDIDGGRNLFSGFGVCPLGDDAANPTHDITFIGNRAANFYNFFTLIGQTTGHQYLSAAGNNASDPTVQAVYAFTGATKDDTVLRQYCGGSIQNVNFQNNVLYLKSVGFYAVPLTVVQTNSYAGLHAPDLTGNGIPAADWYDVLSYAAAQSTGFYVAGNQFIADVDPTTYPTNLDVNSLFHSMIKFQGTSGMVIEGNTFQDANDPDLFGTGAVVNVAFNNLNPVIQENYFDLPTNYAHPNRGIAVFSGFGLHPFYGLGWLSYSWQGDSVTPMVTPLGKAIGGTDVAFGIEGLAGPTLGLRITNNVFNNVFMNVSACCKNSISAPNADMGALAWGGVTPYCSDIDKYQVLGGPKQDDWVVSGNTYNFTNGHTQILEGIPTTTQPAFAAVDNQNFAQRNPGAPFQIDEYCREAFTWTSTNNKACNSTIPPPNNCQPSK